MSSSEVNNTLSVNQIENASEAFKLAAVETKINNPPQSLVSSFDSTLKKLAKKCPNETEKQIANYIYIGRNAIVVKGINMTFFDFASSLNESIPENNNGIIKCAEASAMFVVLIVVPN